MPQLQQHHPQQQHRSSPLVSSEEEEADYLQQEELVSSVSSSSLASPDGLSPPQILYGGDGSDHHHRMLVGSQNGNDGDASKSDGPSPPPAPLKPSSAALVVDGKGGSSSSPSDSSGSLGAAQVVAARPEPEDQMLPLPLPLPLVPPPLPQRPDADEGIDAWSSLAGPRPTPTPQFTGNDNDAGIGGDEDKDGVDGTDDDYEAAALAALLLETGPATGQWDTEYDEVAAAADDPPLTMEDSSSEDDGADAALRIGDMNRDDAVEEGIVVSSSVPGPPSRTESDDSPLLAEYERTVELGSDRMLHHRRLPSTIYEDDTTPALPSTSGTEALPRIASSTLNLRHMGEEDESNDIDADDPANYDTHPGGSSLHRSSWTPASSSSGPDLDNGHGDAVANPTTPTDVGPLRGPDRSPGDDAAPVPRLGSFSNVRSASLRPKYETIQSLTTSPSGPSSPDLSFEPHYASTKMYQALSGRLLHKHNTALAATWIGFWALLHVTCVNYVLTPLRDAIAIKVGVQHIPMLTLASTGLAFVSSVPIGWLFEAPDPSRRKLWKRMGLTRGETQGTSLALFYRCFAVVLLSYAMGFSGIDWLVARGSDDDATPSSRWAVASGQAVYVAFFLVVHLMKLHSLSLVWGVTTEAMEYEEVARKNHPIENSQTRLQRLALVGFGGTLGGILGSGLASSMARILRLPGLLILAAVLLEVSAQLSIELGRVMQTHWETQQLFQSSNDLASLASLASLDTSMKRSASLGSMKRVASGNSLSRVRSATDLSGGPARAPNTVEANDGTFVQRLLRGITTILRSRLLMAIFTYNALYASTTVLLSFQRAELVANRNKSTSAEADTAFLANINMASSIAIFALQASGLGAMLAHRCGPRWTLSLMPLIRLAGVLSLAWWHRFSRGQPPNLLIFLVVDECCKIMNLAVAKPVRESLWRGLSNEARYEAKPIVDTLANRWGGGSAAFLVSFIHHTLDWLGYGGIGPPGGKQTHDRALFGFPPILFLCMVIATWWTAVSADLGQIRSRIDVELKKRQ